MRSGTSCYKTIAAARSWLIVALLMTGVYSPDLSADSYDDLNTAGKRVALLFHSARVVISRNQDIINAGRGLPAETVLVQMRQIYEEVMDTPYMPAPAGSQVAEFEQLLETAITETMNEAQPGLSNGTAEFKGFVPATFGVLVAEKVEKLSKGRVQLAQTNVRVRNRKNRPDEWEKAVFKQLDKAAVADAKQIFLDSYREGARHISRFMLPEYYEPSCLACHGGAAGERDITGSKREGKAEGELGGAVSVTIAR